VSAQKNGGEPMRKGILETTEENSRVPRLAAVWVKLSSRGQQPIALSAIANYLAR
jgi:hypothetical protein